MTRLSAKLFVASAALCVASAAGAQVSGAIHTTTPDGAIVNENVHYTAKAEVFLSGGPGPNAPPGAAGLPPGEYYFQVTDPSGKQLLSTDSARNRCVVVGNQGYIINQRCGAVFGPGSPTAVRGIYGHDGVSLQVSADRGVRRRRVPRHD
jgi:hypothetical protein